MQLLISIGRRAASASSAADVQALIQQIEDYLSGADPQSAGGVAHQEELLAQVDALSERLFGQQTPPFVRSAASKHAGAVEGLRDALAELELLRDTFTLKQQVKPHLQQLQRVIDNTRSGSFDAGSPGKPLVLEGLRSVQLDEGAANSLTLRCKYQSASPTDAAWFLNGQPIDARASSLKASNDGVYASLEIAPARGPKLTTDQSGAYSVLLRNASGEARSSCNVEIRPSGSGPTAAQSPELELPVLVDQREVNNSRRGRAPSGLLGRGPNSDEYPDQWRLGPITSGPEQVPDKLPKSKPRVSPTSDEEQRKLAPVEPPPGAPRFLKPLADVTVSEEDRAQLEARISGDPEPNIRVYYIFYSTLQTYLLIPADKYIFDTVI